MPISKDIAIVIRAFDRTAGGTTKTTANMKKVATVAKAAGVAIAAMGSVAAIAAVRMGKAFINTADETSKLGRKLGLTTEFVSGLDHALKLSGTSMDQVRNGFKTLAQRALDAERGMESAKENFDELGISVTDAKGQLKQTEQLFLEVADSVSKMEDGTRKAALTSELFGRQGLELIPILNAGADGIRDMQHEARELGIEISTNTGRQAEQLNDNLLRLKGAVSGLGRSIAAELLPGLVKSTDDLISWARVALVGSKQSAILSAVVSRLGTSLALTGEIGMIAFSGISEGLKQGTLIAEGYLHQIMGLFSDSGVHGEAFIDVLEEMEGSFTKTGLEGVERFSRVRDLLKELANPSSSGDIRLPEVEGQNVEFSQIGAQTDILEEKLGRAKGAVQSFQGVAQQAFQNVASGIGQAALNAENMGEAVSAVGKGIAQMFIDYMAQRLAMFAFEKTMQAAGMASAIATSAGMAGLGASVAGAWLPAATAVSLATFGANVGPAIAGMAGAFAAASGMAAGSAVLGGLLSGSGLAGQAHAGLDMVPKEGTYLLDRGEAVLQPEANQDLRRMANDYNARGGGDSIINIMLDGEVLARGMGKMSRNGVLQIHAKSVIS